MADATYAIGTATTPLQLQPTPPGGITMNTTAGAYGTNTTGTVGTPGTAQLSGNVDDSATGPNGAGGLIGQTVNVNTIPGSATITPVKGQTFTITNTAHPADVMSLTIASTPTGTPGTGLFLTATVNTDPGNGLYTTGNTISFGSSSNTQSTFTYSFLPGGTGQGSQAASAYYTATITFNNMTGSALNGGTPYFAGVVLTDTANNNYVLSEAQSGIFHLGAFGPTTVPTLTLLPVVAGVYIPTPTAIGATLESTIFLTDEKGYVIPNQNTNVASDNAATLSIDSANAPGLTYADYSGYLQLPATTTSITATPGVPAGAFSTPLTINPANPASATNYASLFGTLLGNYIQPTAPFTLGLNGGGAQVITNVNGIGNPIAIACAAAGLQGFKITLNSTTPATVGGYTYTAGTNVPATGGVVLTSGTLGSSFPSAGSTSAINCNPSIVLPIL